MSDPILMSASVVIKYSSNDGYRSELMAKGGFENNKPVPPERALLAGLEELARITALFGFEDEALQCFEEARQRVAEWKQQRAQEAA